MPNLTINGQSYFAVRTTGHSAAVGDPGGSKAHWHQIRLRSWPCGNFTVHIDGQAVRLLLRPTAQSVQGSMITTIEGLNPATLTQCSWLGSSIRRRRANTASLVRSCRPQRYFRRTQPERTADRGRYDRQSLPLRYLLAHRWRRQASCCYIMNRAAEMTNEGASHA